MFPRRHLPSRSFRSPAPLRTIASALLLAGQLVTPLEAGAFTYAQSGRWTPRKEWEQTPVHMSLLRGKSPNHSTVLWWVGTGYHERFYGGVWGWRPGAQDCSDYPDADIMMRLPFDLPDSTALFCAGHSPLADGRLLLAGGTQPGTEFGIRATYTFDAGADSSAAWQRSDSMAAARWYPSLTTLADGRGLVTSGSHHQHLHFFGGLKNSESAPTDSAVFRYGIGEGGRAETAVRTSSTPLWPGPRVGHSSVYYASGGPTRIFGGKRADGTYSREVWQMRRQGNPSGGDYDYQWSDVTPDEGVTPRWRHIAVATEHAAAPMVVFGGIRKNALNQDEALNDVWRYYYDSLPPVGYKWAEVSITNPGSSSAPGARHGHAAVWHAPSRSATIFGGTATPGGAPTDSGLYRLTFAPDMASATWSKLNAAGPGPRSDLGLVFNSEWRDAWYAYAYAFGGALTSGKSNELWELRLTTDPDSVSWRKITHLGGTPPSPRSGHTLIADGGNHLLYAFGGTSPAGSADDTVYVAHLDSLKIGERRQWAPYARNSAALTGHTAVFEDGAVFAREAEVYSPASQGWSTLGSPLLQQWYPQTFVIKPDTVYVTGPDDVGRKRSISTGANTVFPGDTTHLFKGGAAVLYGPGKFMKAGSRDTDGRGDPAVGTTYSADLNAGPATEWRASPNSMAPRVNHNLVLLPDGKVLVVGGTGMIDNDAGTSPEYRPEIWDPGLNGGLGLWRYLDTLATQPTMRDYHSTALLLPDGRVLCGGGNADQNLRSSAEIYCPPYLFDGNSLATRPTLIAATGRWRYGREVTFAVSGDTTIRRACLIRAGSTTHGQDMSQRYVPLTLQSASSRADGVRQFLLQAPADSFVAPPGDYLLFASSAAGVPSVAQWVRVGFEENGQFDSSPPDSFALQVTFIGCTSIGVDWLAPGNNGSTGTALDYDVRYSTNPITPINIGQATPANGVGMPMLAGTPQNASAAGLAGCTWYHFGGQATDGAGNWSLVSHARAKTPCGYCEDPGESMARGRSEAGGSNAASGLAAVKSFAVPMALGASGSSLRLVAHYVPGTGAEWRLAYEDLVGDPAALAGGASDVLVQDTMPGGDWVTRSTYRTEGGPLAVRAPVREGRVVFPAGTTLSAVEPAPFGYLCSTAGHSRLGDLLAPGSDFPSVSLEATSGDTLRLGYASEPSSTAGEDFFFRVRVPGATAQSRARRGRTPEPSRDLDLPASFALLAPRPNPFSSATAIRFDLPRASHVRIEVFDVQGRRVAVVADGPAEAGRHAARWDGSGELGLRVPAGIYLCRMSAGDFRAERRISLMR